MLRKRAESKSFNYTIFGKDSVANVAFLSGHVLWKLLGILLEYVLTKQDTIIRLKM